MQLHKFILTLIFLLFVATTFVQAQSAFKYQAVIRDADGNAIRETMTDVRLSLHAEFGDIIYSELHTEMTINEFGIIA